MKRKIALLLAAVMTVASVPVNVFANPASFNINRGAVTVPRNTVLVEQGVTINYPTITNNSRVENVAEGLSATMVFSDEQVRDNAGGDLTFNLNLNNAEWFFRGDSGSTANTEGGVPTTTFRTSFPGGAATLNGSNVYTRNINDRPVGGANSNISPAITPAFTVVLPTPEEVAGATNASGLTLLSGRVSDYSDEVLDFANQLPDNPSHLNNALELSLATEAISLAIADRIQALIDVPATGQELADLQTLRGTHANVSSSVRANTAEIRLLIDDLPAPPAPTTPSEVSYRMQLPISNTGSARVTIPQNTLQVAGDSIVIPLVTLTTSENAASSVNVSGANFNHVTDTRTFANSTSATGRTTTRATNPRTARDRFPVDSITITENVARALPASGSFEIVAPSGYQFENNANSLRLVPEGGLTFGNPTPGNTSNYTFSINNDRTVLSVSYNGLVSSNNAGRLVIVNTTLGTPAVTFVPRNADYVRDGNLNASIRSVGSARTVEAESFLVGTAAEYNVGLTRIGDAPELINGRLDSVYTNNVNDRSHRTASVRFQESVNNAWWANRNTTFTLPEGVRFRQVEFRNVRNIQNPEVLNGTFHNTGNRNTGSSSVRINDNVMTLSGLNTNNTGTNNNARASFEMDIWVNIESGFTGNIDLTLGGPSINQDARDTENYRQSVTIATAINPIRVETEVSNVQLGHQFVDVANFRIVETVAGALPQGEEVFITVTDHVTTDIQIAPGFNAEVTNGNLQIRNVRTGTNVGLGNQYRSTSGANISFEIQRASSTPSTIEFSNVQVRLPQNISAEAGQRDYDVVVWGPAIAANFEGVMPTVRTTNVNSNPVPDNVNVNDFFRTPGISTPFIRVGSQANGLIQEEVRVTNGSKTVVIGYGTENQRTVEMPVAPYVSPQSDSMMVPIRFVSEVLGVPAQNVIWNAETSTATIVIPGGNTVEFVSNSSTMSIQNPRGQRVNVGMQNANGGSVYSEVRYERMFIPFRQLGNAFNIFVDWDAATSTAILDPSRPSSTPALLEDNVA